MWESGYWLPTFFYYFSGCKCLKIILYWMGEAGKTPITKNVNLFIKNVKIGTRGRHP